VILTTLYLASVKNIDNWHARQGDLQRDFPLDVLMVPSSTIAIKANGERLTCGGFSLSETIHLGNFEVIVDYFGSLNLSPTRGDQGATFMGSTHSRVSTPRWAMMEASTEESLRVLSGEGSFSLPSPRRRSTGGMLAPGTTTPWMQNTPAT
jgi:hypothetical protein